MLNSTYKEVAIPLSDFVELGLDMSKLTIPYALRKPQDVNDEFTGGNILSDNIHFEL